MLITDKTKLSEFSAEHRVWQGIPGIARTQKGKTFISFYSGNTKEYFGNYALVICSENDTDFGGPIVAAYKAGDYRCFDPVLWIDPLNRLWFIWNVMPGEEVYASICEDPDADVLSWSEEFYIGRGVMMNKPVVLSSGEWLFPIAFWKLDFYKEMRKSGLRSDDIFGSFVYKTSDNGKTFVRLGFADIRKRSFDEHMVIELENEVLKMLVRTEYGIAVSYSYDRGKNWSRGEDSKLGGPCSRFFIKRLNSGRILLINHHNYTGRNNLTAFLSEDDGKTFPYTLLLDERDNVSYPDAIESDDGSIYIVYDRERGCFKHSLQQAYDCAREILTAKITEADIMAGKIVTHGSFLKNVVSKLGFLAKDDADPYLKSADNIKLFAETLMEHSAEDAIKILFERYPVNCINVTSTDANKLDTLIRRFTSQEKKNPSILVQIIEFIQESPATKKEISPIIESCKAYIDQHLSDEFSVNDLAEQMQISVYYLSHLFKSVTGTTIIEYRNEQKLTEAKKMLIFTEMPIGEIAQKTGFCSAPYFAEVFLKSETVSPSDYRKYHKK